MRFLIKKMSVYIKHGRIRTNKGIIGTMQTVARAKHYCDVITDYCQQVTKQNTWVIYLKNKIKWYGKGQWLKNKIKI